MFCRFCGNKILEDSLFCQFCGKQLSQSSALACSTDVQPTPLTMPEPEEVAVLESTPEPAAELEPAVVSAPESTPEPTMELEPVVVSAPESTPEPTVEPTVEPEPAVVSESAPTITSMPASHVINIPSSMLFTDERVLDRKDEVKDVKQANFASTAFWTGFLSTLLQILKMAEVDLVKTHYFYLIAIIVVSCLAGLIYKIRSNNPSTKHQRLMLVFGLILLISSVGLRVIYESNVNRVVANVPLTGTVRMQPIINSSFGGYPGETSVEFIVDRKNRPNRAPFEVSGGKEYATTINVRWGSNQTKQRNITFTSTGIRNGILIKETFNGWISTSNITVLLRRVCSYQEVFEYLFAK